MDQKNLVLQIFLVIPSLIILSRPSS